MTAMLVIVISLYLFLPSKAAASDLFDGRQCMEFDLDLSSKYYLLSKDYHGENYIMYGRGIDERIYPASLTKLMTMVVALDHIEDPSERIVATYEDMEGLLEANASILGVWAGNEISLDTAFYGLILPSGADCANILKRYVEDKTGQDFIDLMNQKARELGMDNTHFANVSGLFDEANYATLEDLNKLMQYILADERALNYVTTWVKEQDGYDIEMTMNKYRDLLQNEYAEVIGGKTGYIPESLLNYACFIQEGDEIAILIISGAEMMSDDGYPGHVHDVKLILDTYFDGV